METKKILLIGRWGKTHAFAKAIVEQSSQKAELYCYMDKPNAGIINLTSDYKLGNLKDNKKIIKYALEKKADFVIAIPHMTLSNSLVDDMIACGIRCIGPTEECSRLETEKSYLRQLLKELNLDVSPKYKHFSSKEDAIDYINSIDNDFAIKPVGVTEGDGVKVTGIQLQSKEEALEYIHEIFSKNIGGISEILIEEKLVGREFTIQAFVDGNTAWGMPATRDYKLLYENEKGLNTPGMGSISFPDHHLPFLSLEEYNEALEIMTKVVNHLTGEYNEIYIGFLSGQFIKTKTGIKVIEFNVRPGDSEILNIIPILKTDFIEICEAMIDNKLDKMNIEYENKATVCKYVVPDGFPHPNQDMKMEIDEDSIKKAGGELFYSCFSVAKNIYKPSPRGVAITAKGDTLEEAYNLCESLIKENIIGQNIWHREDIGSKNLLKKYVKKMIKVEEHKADDFSKIHDIAGEIDGIVQHPTHVYKIMADHFGHTFFVAREYQSNQNKILGFMLGFLSERIKGHLFIWQIAVTKNTQGKGVGSKLMDYTINYAKNLDNCHKILATVETDNFASQSLFEKYNFEIKSGNYKGKNQEIIFENEKKAVKNYYGSGTNQIFYVLEV